MCMWESHDIAWLVTDVNNGAQGGRMASKDFYCLHSEMCKTLSNPKRQEILDNLRDSELSVGQLVEATGIAQANLSQHLSILRAKGIVTSRRDGSSIFYRIANPKIIKAFDIMSEVLREALEEQSARAKS